MPLRGRSVQSVHSSRVYRGKALHTESTYLGSAREAGGVPLPNTVGEELNTVGEELIT